MGRIEVFGCGGHGGGWGGVRTVDIDRHGSGAFLAAGEVILV